MIPHESCHTVCHVTHMDGSRYDLFMEHTCMYIYIHIPWGDVSGEVGRQVPIFMYELPFLRGAPYWRTSRLLSYTPQNEYGAPYSCTQHKTHPQHTQQIWGFIFTHTTQHIHTHARPPFLCGTPYCQTSWLLLAWP